MIVYYHVLLNLNSSIKISYLSLLLLLLLLLNDNIDDYWNCFPNINLNDIFLFIRLFVYFYMFYNLPIIEFTIIEPFDCWIGFDLRFFYGDNAYVSLSIICFFCYYIICFYYYDLNIVYSWNYIEPISRFVFLYGVTNESFFVVFVFF